MRSKLHRLDYAQKVYGFLPALCAPGRTASKARAKRTNEWVESRVFQRAAVRDGLELKLVGE